MAPKSYVDFDVSIIGRRGAEGYDVTAELPLEGGVVTGTLKLDPSSDEVLEAMDRIEERDTNERFFTEFGGQLFEALFADKVLSLYQRAFGAADAADEGVRVRLRVDQRCRELMAVPWEYLYDSFHKNGIFLSISADTLLTRYILAPEAVEPMKVKLPLKVLVIISNPVDLEQQGFPTLDVAAERQRIEGALSGLAGRVELRVLPSAEPADVRQTMRQFPPHIVHFIGHGTFEGGRAYLLMEDADGRSAKVHDRRFRQLLEGQDQARLVILNACQSAAGEARQPVDERAPLAGMAANLAEGGVPAVLAMQHTIADRTAILLAQEFYRALAAGRPVDGAVNEVRRAIYVDVGPDERDWGTPVLFLRARDGVLFGGLGEEGEEPAAPTSGPTPAGWPNDPEALLAEAERFLEARKEAHRRSGSSVIILSDAEREVESKMKQLRTHLRNLRTAEERVAMYGELDAPLHLVNSVESYKERVAELVPQLQRALTKASA